MKLERFEFFFVSEAAIRAASSWAPKLPPLEGLVNHITTQRRVVRVILPYTERWEGLAQKLKNLQKVWEGTFEKLRFKIVVQVAFCKGGKQLVHSLRFPVKPDLHVYRQALRQIRGR